MKILFYYTGAPSPILETMFELIRQHDSLGDHIRVLQCKAILPNCFWNPKKSYFACQSCISKFKNGIEVLNPSSNVEILNLSVLNIDLEYISSLKFRNVEELSKFKYKGQNIGIGVASRLISLFRDHRFDTNKFESEIQKELTTAIYIYETIEKELIETTPDKVYIFNGRITTENPVVLLCKKLNIEYYTYEISFAPNKYSVRKNSTAHSIAALIDEMEYLWESASDEKYTIAKYWFDNKRAHKNIYKLETFVKDQVRHQLPDFFDYTKKNIAIFNSTLDEFCAIDGWENHIYNTIDDTVAIKKIITEFNSDSNYFFYLRVHPNLRRVSKDTSQLKDLLELEINHKNIKIIWPDEQIDSYALMDICDQILVFSSTIGVEAAYWGKPVILASRAFYETLDCIYKPQSHEEVIKLIKSNLTPLSNESALKYAYREISSGINFKYFKENGVNSNNLAYGKFDDKEIKSNLILKLLMQTELFVSKLKFKLIKNK